MKCTAAVVLLFILALSPLAMACDPHPGAVTGALTVSVRNCFTTNYTAKDMVAACSDLRTLIAVSDLENEPGHDIHLHKRPE